MDQGDGLKPVTKEKKFINPYNGVVKVAVWLGQELKSACSYWGTGFIVQKNIVMTAAHLLYNKRMEKYFSKILVYLYQNQSEKFVQIKVKNTIIDQQYKTINLVEARNYQLAILQLEDNKFINSKMFIQLKFDFNRQKYQNVNQLLIIAFLEQFDQKKIVQQNCGLIGVYQKFLQYNIKIKNCNGLSGAPLLIVQNGKYKAIGFHIGEETNRLKIGIKFQSKSNSSYQILKELMSKTSLQNTSSIFPKHQQVKLNQKSNNCKCYNIFQKQNTELKENIKWLRSQNSQLKQELELLKKKEELELLKKKEVFKQDIDQVKQRAQFLCQKSSKLVIQKKFEQADKCLSKCLKILTSIYPKQDNKLHKQILSCQSNSKFQQGQYKESIETLEKILKLKENLKEQNQVHQLEQIGINYYYMNKNDKALTYFDKVIIYFEKNSQTSVYNSKKALQYSGQILNQKGDEKKALEKFQQYMTSFDKEMNNWENLNNLATTFQLMGQTEEAKKYYDKVQKTLGLSICDQHDFTKSAYSKQASKIYNKAQLLLAKGQYSQALKNYNACAVFYEDRVSESNFFVQHLNKKIQLMQSKSKNI